MLAMNVFISITLLNESMNEYMQDLELSLGTHHFCSPLLLREIILSFCLPSEINLSFVLGCVEYFCLVIRDIPLFHQCV